MGELPGASDTQHGELNKRPPDDTSVCRLGLISELGLAFLERETKSAPHCHTHTPKEAGKQAKPQTHPLENLLAANILQTSIEVLDL